MEIDRLTLFIEINDKNYIFVAGKYDENQNLKVIEKIITPSTGIDKKKFISKANSVKGRGNNRSKRRAASSHLQRKK